MKSTITPAQYVLLMQQPEPVEDLRWSIITATEFCHGLASASGWWNDVYTGEDQRPLNNVPEKLMLIVSELGEAMEGHRKDLMDEHLPNRKSVEVELADAVIRIFDLAGAKNYDLAGAIVDKLTFNQQRFDHTKEARLAQGGKTY